jgi:drug/metabolite transporter (DMT)-like permease
VSVLQLSRRHSVSTFLPAGASAATAILVGSAIVATRLVISQTSPVSLALLRYLIGICCLLPPVFLSGRVRFEPRDLAPIGLLGIIQFGVLIVLLNFALQFVSAARAALIFATMPLLAMMLASALRLESLTFMKTLAVLLTIAGVAFALGEKAILLHGRAGGEWVGELAAFASALSGAICSVLYRPYLRKYPTLSVSALAMLASVGFLGVLAAGGGFFHSLPRFTAAGWLAVLFIGISSGIGYYLWLWALNHSTPTKVTAFLALSPMTATGLGAVLLREEVSTMFIVGLGCVVAGLWFAQASPQ